MYCIQIAIFLYKKSLIYKISVVSTVKCLFGMIFENFFLDKPTHIYIYIYIYIYKVVWKLMFNFRINFYSWMNEFKHCFNQSKWFLSIYEFLFSINKVFYACKRFWCQEIFKCNKVSYPKSVSFCSVILVTCLSIVM